MNRTEKENSIIKKSNFFRINNLKAHVLIIPRPRFKHGIFKSELLPGDFFWFRELDQDIDKRLFLCDIYDVEEYKEALYNAN